MLPPPANNPALPGDSVVGRDRTGCAEAAVRAASPHSPVYVQTEAHSGEDQDLGQQSQAQENFATARREGSQHTLPKLRFGFGCCLFDLSSLPHMTWENARSCNVQRQQHMHKG